MAITAREPVTSSRDLEVRLHVYRPSRNLPYSSFKKAPLKGPRTLPVPGFLSRGLATPGVEASQAGTSPFFWANLN